ncbi:MAG: hypothetical protein A3G66_02065 [Candidatus Levybacteria bacterium RIFCSPLOWO2_12_FULL_39_17]|nr:MAG: hypothetical protein UT20_C0002G0019 [Candidatus Levybacteria bacterium GW2011_GWA1_39_11]OGH15353.1 MAG: hypothetical protein A2689_01475 [Candidatus Levybacteria bacterium RIFCSPHIGHO2_01_FULL_38_96]OGH36273.1 MAG: hypothetical protein A3B43_02550 [Candidatus Levybacteria bacterium RIFCSPLOWO2_01_FULL_38_120]OGH47826.1 MAG: hypothetical protein A3G66_02065 [Candidatus Levybacteria bacterium RIFCSPLOWO2_12_FULL_39_17]
MIKLLTKRFYLILFSIVVLIFFSKTLFSALLPIPADTIVGLYHPFRDLYAKEYPRGIPYKNFLITDPVRQIIPWKNLSVESLARFEFPLWNPYEMAGKPHIANFQSGTFYPLNLVLFIKPYYISWSIFVMLQPVLAGFFMFAYLKNLKLDSRASILGAISFSFSGFSIAWFEWGNIVHTALWLPLLLLSVDKIFEHFQEISNIKYKKANIHSKNKKLLIWFGVLLFSSIFSFFAGHLQIFFYLSVMSIAYFIFRWFEYGKKFRTIGLFIIYYLLFIITTAIQWIPTLQFINLSARIQDQAWIQEGWFVPLQHLVQFLIPDFFGNPTTLNYWGTWNYGELIGYVGIISLVFVMFSLASDLNRNKLFFLGTIVVALLFATENPISRLPYEFGVPFISSSQPTRLIFLIAFGLSVLSAIGFDFLIKQKKMTKRVLVSVLIPLVVLVLVWVASIGNPFGISQENLSVLKRNLIFPSMIFVVGIFLIIIFSMVKKDSLRRFVLLGIILVVSFDLLRFGWKFTSFTKSEYFYPQTKTIKFLKKDKDVFRIASTDSRIFPPNFSTYYKIQSIEGYDPLYLNSYAELMAASERGEPNIDPPFGFNRILTPHNLDSKFINLLNVKYVLSFSDLDPSRFEKVFEEGETKIFLNREFLSRAFFVEKIIVEKRKNAQLSEMFYQNLNKTAIVEDQVDTKNLNIGKAKIMQYSDNKVIIETENPGDGFLFFGDVYYPTWKVSIDGKKSKIYKTNHTFRGIFVPPGNHRIVFYNSLF